MGRLVPAGVDLRVAGQAVACEIRTRMVLWPLRAWPDAESHTHFSIDRHRLSRFDGDRKAVAD